MASSASEPLTAEELHLVNLFRQVPAPIKPRLMEMLQAVLASVTPISGWLLALGWCLDL